MGILRSIQYMLGMEIFHAAFLQIESFSLHVIVPQYAKAL